MNSNYSWYDRMGYCYQRDVQQTFYCMGRGYINGHFTNVKQTIEETSYQAATSHFLNHLAGMGMNDPRGILIKKGI